MTMSAGFDLSRDEVEVCYGGEAVPCGVFSFARPGLVDRQADRLPSDDGIEADVMVAPRRYWWGHDGNSTMNLITAGVDDRVFGSMTSGITGLIYDFGYNAEGAPLVRASHTDEFNEMPPEGPDHDHEGHPVPQQVTNLSSGPARQRRQSNLTAGDDGSILDVLVVWTVRAECSNADISAGDCTLAALTTLTFELMVGKVELAIAETNTACETPPPLSSPP